MDVCVKLLAYDVWVAEDDKTGFLSVGVDIFDRLYLKELNIYFPVVPMSTKTKFLLQSVPQACDICRRA